MADLGGGPLFDYVRQTIEKTCAELARRLGRPVPYNVSPSATQAAAAWAEEVGGQALLAAASLSGRVRGRMCYLLGVPDALKIAKAVGEDVPPDGQESLREADTAAVVFFLSRFGAKAAELALASFAMPLEWAADPTSLEPQVVDLSAGPDALATAIGEENCRGFAISLAEPFGATIHLLFPERTAAALEASIAGAGRASDLARVLPVAIPVRVVLGRRRMSLREVLRLVPGEVLRLERRVEEPLDLEASGKIVASGSAVEADGRMAIRITAVTAPSTGQP